MIKHELLVPVGNWPSLEAAIHNGADAVYLGGKKFGARAFADNFSLTDLEKATKLCHLYGVKIYVTVNTLIYENEIAEVLEYIKSLHQMGVDALIMQDVGLINLVHQTLPNLEIHASTQMHNHSSESLEFLKSLGVKRVVFARELSLDYINNIDTDLEKEVFIHGSLCISYSGQCLFSSQILGRSGNRGECAGMCRLPYKLYEEDKIVPTNGDYLLSPKDLCSIDDFSKLMQSDIKCFKIEGRMKSAEYVAVVTRIYHKLILDYENNKSLKVDEEDFNLLKAIFNREYTKGYLNNAKDIMNISAPNHEGIKIGEVIKVTPKKIAIKLNHNLKQFEGIRFLNHDIGINVNFIYDENDKLINEGVKGKIIYLDNFINLDSLDTVMLTKPKVDIYPDGYKKIPVSLSLKAKIGTPLEIQITDGENSYTLKSTEVVQKSLNAPISAERIKEVLSQVGDLPFQVENIDIDMDKEIFISIGTLKNLRRSALKKLKDTRENKKVPYVEKEFKDEKIDKKIQNGISVLVRTKEQLQACKDLKIKNIIVQNPKLWKEDLIYKIPRDNLVRNYTYKNLLVTDYASLFKYPNSRSDYYLNVTNHYTLDYINRYASVITLSPENTLENISNIMQHYHNNINVEVLVYGRLELMLMKYCPLNYLVNKDSICHVCQNNKRYYLQDRNGAFYPIESNPLTHSTTILNTNLTDLRESIPNLKDMGVNNFRIELFDESYEKTKEIIEGVKKYVE